MVRATSLYLAATMLAVATPAFAEAFAGKQKAAVQSEGQIRQDLQGAGYSKISKMTRHGAVYTADATRWGRSTPNLRIEGATGEVLNPGVLTRAQVKTLLKQNGYSDVSDLQHNGAMYAAIAAHDGNRGRVKIDASSGTIFKSNAINSKP